MTKLPTVVRHNKFIHNYNKLDNSLKIKVNKQLAKIVKNPKIGNLWNIIEKELENFM